MTAADHAEDQDGPHADRETRADLVEVHRRSNRLGHYWQHWDNLEPPEWYQEDQQKPLSPARDGEELPPEHQPDVPEDWDPTNYARYRCKVCGDPCINPVESVYRDTTQCRSCYLIPALDEPTGATDAEVRASVRDVED